MIAHSWPILLGQVSLRLFFWLLLLIGLIIAAAAGVLYLRRWYGTTDEGPVIGFTLGDLRRLHADGQMTDAEFELAKAKIVAASRAALAKPATKSKNDPHGVPIELKEEPDPDRP